MLTWVLGFQVNVVVWWLGDIPALKKRSKITLCSDLVNYEKKETEK